MGALPLPLPHTITDQTHPLPTERAVDVFDHTRITLTHSLPPKIIALIFASAI